MSKFTPGPWHTEVVGDGPVALAIADKDMNSLLTLVVEDDMVFAAVFNQDDAALMADAPGLLDALKSLLDSIPSLTCESFHHARKDQHQFDDECPPFERYLAEAIKARALIAKHRGGV